MLWYIFTVVSQVELYRPKHGRTDSEFLRWRDRRFNAPIRIDRRGLFDRHHRPRGWRAHLSTRFSSRGSGLFLSMPRHDSRKPAGVSCRCGPPCPPIEASGRRVALWSVTGQTTFDCLIISYAGHRSALIRRGKQCSANEKDLKRA